MQDAEDNNDDSFVLIEKAKEHQEYGESIAMSDAKDPRKCQPFLDSLILALVKRESALGKYTYETAQTYASMGKLYFHMHHPRAAVMFRASFRIEYFLYGKCSGRIAGDFKGFLLERGLSDNDTDAIRKDIVISARYEVEGDILRRFGDRRAAAMEYQKAARIEELAFGKDNPDLAFLWRKMACLASIRKANMHIVDFDECDRLGSKWINEAQDHISSSVSAGITKGDKYYQSLLYGKATREYVKAALGDKPRPILKPKPRRNNANRRTSTEGASVQQELQNMIAPTTSSNSSVQSRPRRVQSGPPVNTKPQNAFNKTVGSENVAIKVSADAVPLSATQSVGTASQDSSLHSRRLNNNISQQQTRDLEEKSEDFDTVAVASSVATSDDGSWYSENLEQQDAAKQKSSLETKQRPFLATSLYEMVSKNSSRALGDTGSKKPKSESALRYMTIKPATKFANRAMNKLRKKKKGTPISERVLNAPEGSNYATWSSTPPTDLARGGNAENMKEASSVDSNSNLRPPTKALHQNGMPVITEMSSPESSSSPTENEIPSASMRSRSRSRSHSRSRRTVPGQSARRFSSESFSEDMMMGESNHKPRSSSRRQQAPRRFSSESFSEDMMMGESSHKPRSSSSRRQQALDRAKAATEHRPHQQQQQQQRQPRQRVFKKVIPTSNYNQHQQRDVDRLAKVGGSENPFLVFEDPSNSSSSPSPTGLSKRR
ncbi:unnamed protein product [Cylindrotheca closterium]|uniref:Uncharacterized protein n=1 Tax=Cylindrotheca closterium TaxID=2856 RepID=A0AAD2PV45_9STRA|nr:unnamed protein product [Cylindrotheca closterium]